MNNPDDRVLLISQNDIALVRAMSDAYRSTTNGVWIVRKSDDDLRKFMPEDLYCVIKKGDDVSVSRKIYGFRKIEDEGKNITVKGFEVSPETYFNEFGLCGNGRMWLDNDCFNIPWHLRECLPRLKKLAKDSSTLTDGDIAIINHYYQFALPNSWVKGQDVWKDKEIRERVDMFTIKGLKNKLNDAGHLVRKIEGNYNSKERRG